ncbi:MAG TPA: CDP-diacylglycerol--serine O-phosphatidyltransferase [Bacteroidales bacterium]|nr:CDP-diacylglycerol--serine O-phosphatidyltransferase [Bacteroidales bacterium]HRZ48514.1 CDP-diacylglycerol--serine O-phosphatidyltransferase [Bacteroidales bacterium]
MIKFIPSVLTLANLLCGFAAIALADPWYSMLLIVTGAILDSVDGLVARALHAESEFGKQADSLADLVTFGVAPALLIFQMLFANPLWISLSVAALIPLGAAIRLATFNTDTRQKTSFRGLPTPAAGLFLAPLPWLEYSGQIDLFFRPVSLILFVLIALLMVLPVPMFSFKALKNKGIDRIFPLALLAGSLLLVIFFGWGGLPLGVVLYILLSILYGLIRKNNLPTG